MLIKPIIAATALVIATGTMAAEKSGTIAGLLTDEGVPPSAREAAAEYATVTATNAGVYAEAPVELYKYMYNFACDVSSERYVGWNAYYHNRALQNADDIDLVSPNSDTLYSQSPIDLSSEPMVLEVPPLPPGDSRYYSHMLVDAWTNNVTYLGVTAEGPKFGKFLLVGPGWTGKPPKKMTVINFLSPVLIDFVRTEPLSAEDPSAWAIQDAISLKPLSEELNCKNGKKPGCQVSDSDLRAQYCQTVPDRDFDPLAFWKIFNRVQTLSPPPAFEAGLTATYKQIGVGPGEGEDELDELSGIWQDALIAGEEAALEQMDGMSVYPGPTIDAWTYSLGVPYGNINTGVPYDYVKRGIVAKVGLLANSTAEALYALGFTDENGGLYNGAGNNYTITFAAGSLPPVRSFWSVTLYKLPSYLLYDNGTADLDDDVYAVGDRSGLVPNADGTVTLFVQHEPPADPALRPNWLPAPEGAFYLLTRFYLPDPDLLNLVWTMPPAASTPR